MQPLWQHQQDALTFLIGRPAAMLEMGMGSGKSRTAITAIERSDIQTVLIVCPHAVVPVWPRQFAQFATEPYMMFSMTQGTLAKRADTLRDTYQAAKQTGKLFVAVVNYEAVFMGMMGTTLRGLHFDAIILDESHRIKKPGGKASLFLSRLGEFTRFRLCLTGTPMPHGPLDIYAQYRFLDKRVFGTSFTAFRARYATMVQIGPNVHAKKITGYTNLAELREKYKSIAFQVRTEDVLNLPPEVDTTIPISLGKQAMRAYRELSDDMVTAIGEGVMTVSNALTRLLRLQQLTGGWAQTDRDIETGLPGALHCIDTAKHDALRDVINDLDEKEPLVVFGNFTKDLEAVRMIADECGGGYSELSGHENTLSDWQAGKTRFLGVQIRAGSVGVDFTRARYAVYYSLGFSLGDYLQSRRRINRPGQTRTTTNIHLVAQGTIDEDVYQALQAKQDCVQSILGKYSTNNGGPHE